MTKGYAITDYSGDIIVVVKASSEKEARKIIKESKKIDSKVKESVFDENMPINLLKVNII